MGMGDAQTLMAMPQAMGGFGGGMLAMDFAPAPECCRGTANAARVSRGSEVDVWPGLSVKKPERHREEHVTVTIVIYNTIADGVPSEEDVLAAIDDLESLYEACRTSGK